MEAWLDIFLTDYHYGIMQEQPQMTPLENQTQNLPEMGKENLTYIPSKTSLVNTLKKTVAKKGSPNVLAPGIE